MRVLGWGGTVAAFCFVVSSNVYLYLMLYFVSRVFVTYTYTSRECEGGWRWGRVVVLICLGVLVSTLGVYTFVLILFCKSKSQKSSSFWGCWCVYISSDWQRFFFVFPMQSLLVDK